MGSPPSDQNQANPPNSDSPPSNNSVSSPPPPDSSSSDSTSPPAPPQAPTLTSPSPSPPSVSRSPNRPTKTLTPQQQPSQSPPPPSTNGKQPSPPSSPSLPQSSNSPTTPSNGSSTNNAPFVAGALAGLGVLIILCVVVLVASCRRKRKKSHDHEDYFNEQANMKDHDFKHNSKWPNRASHQSFNMPNQPAMGWPAPPMISTDASENYSTGPRQAAVPPPHPLVALGLNKNSFTYDELAGATQGFSQANVLGQGGFGFVYKGVLPNGKEIAVKCLKSGSGQGEREFQAEVDIISRVHHRHLVSLVGYCIAGGQRMLVYEFVPNNTLEFHLHGKGQPPMDFPLRLKIALGSAKGLAYLHEDCHPRIIHRDIKTANILLDQDFEAKVADFGLAKLSNDNNTHVSTRVMGTFGYLAPEYASSGKLTNKSDVFSFSVVLLELITGRRPINPTGDDDGLVDWARPQLATVLDEGNFEGVVDPRLENNFNTQEMTRLVACAAASIRHSSKKRPKMSQIVRALEGDMSLEALNEGVKPGQTMYFGGEAVTSEYNASLYRKDMEKFKRALDSDESNTSSSEYGASSSS